MEPALLLASRLLSVLVVHENFLLHFVVFLTFPISVVNYLMLSYFLMRFRHFVYAMIVIVARHSIRPTPWKLDPMPLPVDERWATIVILVAW